MANIGTFTKTEQGFTGELVTLSLKVKNVRLVVSLSSSSLSLPEIRDAAPITPSMSNDGQSKADATYDRQTPSISALPQDS